MGSNAWKNQRRRERDAEREAQLQAEADALQERKSNLWFLPDGCSDEYVEMEDAIGEHGARAVFAFLEAVHASRADPTLAEN